MTDINDNHIYTENSQSLKNDPQNSVISKIGTDEKSLNGLQKKSYEELLSKVAADKDLQGKHLDYKFLIKFLLCHKFDVNETFNHIKGYFKIRKAFPGLYLKPSEVVDVYKKKILFRSHVRGPNGEGYVILRACQWRPGDMTAEHACAAGIAYTETAPVDDERRRAGIWEVVDVKGLNWSQIWALKMSDYKMFAEATEVGQTLRINGIIAINASYIVDYVYNKIMKWCFTKEFRDKIRIYSGDWSEIFEFIPANALPVDMKGSLEGADFNEWSVEELEKLDKVVEKYWERYK